MRLRQLTKSLELPEEAVPPPDCAFSMVTGRKGRYGTAESRVQGNERLNLMSDGYETRDEDAGRVATGGLAMVRPMLSWWRTAR